MDGIKTSLFRFWFSEETDVTSVTRLDYVWKVCVTNFSAKVAQIFDNFLGYFEKSNFASSTTVLRFRQSLVKLGNFLFEYLVTLTVTYFDSIFSSNEFRDQGCKTFLPQAAGWPDLAKFCHSGIIN